MPTNDQQETIIPDKGPIFLESKKLSEELLAYLRLSKGSNIGISRAKYDGFKARESALIEKNAKYGKDFTNLHADIKKSLLEIKTIVQEKEKITEMLLKVTEYSVRTNEKFSELLNKSSPSDEAYLISGRLHETFVLDEDSKARSEAHNKSSSSAITELQTNMNVMFKDLRDALTALSTPPANDHAKRSAFKIEYLRAIGECEEAINRYPDRTLSEWFLDQCHELRVLFNTFINKITSKSNEAEADEKIAPNVKSAPNSRKIFAECKNLITDLRDEMYEAAEEISSAQKNTDTKP